MSQCYDTPAHLQFDTYNFCNLACQYCYRHATPLESTRMPLHLVEQLMKQTVDLKLNSIRPYLNGDPLFESRLPEIIEIIRKYNSSRIVLFTNATNYPTRLLLTNPEVSEIHVTISAATPHTYALVHGRPLLKQALRTLNWLEQHINSRQRIFLHYVITKQNLNELEAWKEQHKRFLQVVSGLHKGIRDKQITSDILPDVDVLPLTTFKGYLFGMPCHIWNNQAISVHGDYLQCCNSPIELTYGNIRDTSMVEAWRRRCANQMQNDSCRNCNCRAPNWKEILEAPPDSSGR